MHESVEVPELPVMDEVDSEQVRTVEFAEAERATVPVNPFRGETVTVEDPESPELNVSVNGLAEMAKSRDDWAETWTLAECDSEPLVPVTVKL